MILTDLVSQKSLISSKEVKTKIINEEVIMREFPLVFDKSSFKLIINEEEQENMYSNETIKEKNLVTTPKKIGLF